MKICIIGGGHAGWWTAGYFEKHLPEYDITLYESSDIPILGVGESTLPQIKTWFDELGIPEETWMNSAGAIKKYGNWKQGWDNPVGDPFTLRFWYNDGDAFDDLMNKPTSYNYVPGRDRTLKREVFQELFDIPGGWMDYAYHLDANGAADIVKRHCKNVKIVNDTLNDLPEGYDLYIDCTGFSRKFIKDRTEMKISDYHFVDSALVLPLEKEDSDKDTCVTKSIARRYGWQFEVCLEHRVGTGYIYSSRHVHDEDARLEFEHHMIAGRKPYKNMKPRLIGWTPMVLENPWSENVVAIGSSAGFVDPLEATALYMTQSGITSLVKCLKRGSSPSAYNKLMRRTWKEGLDFQLAHYALNNRDDTGFWRRMRDGDEYLSNNRQEKYSKMLWEKYETKTNKFTTMMPSGLWCQLGVYLDSMKHYVHRNY